MDDAHNTNRMQIVATMWFVSVIALGDQGNQPVRAHGFIYEPDRPWLSNDKWNDRKWKHDHPPT